MDCLPGKKSGRSRKGAVSGGSTVIRSDFPC